MSRVLLLTFDAPEKVGGIEGRSRNYGSELQKRGHFVITLSLSPEYHHRGVDENNSRVIRLNSSVSLLPTSILTALSLMIKNSLESVVLVSGSLSLLGLSVLAYSRMSGRRTVALLYGRDIMFARKSLGGRVFLPCALRLANCVVVNSRFTEGLLPRRGKYLIIYPTVDLGISRRERSAHQGGDRKRILFVGRLVARKGVDLLLRAFRELLDEELDLELDIVGNGPEMPSARRLASELSIDRLVTFHGTLTGPRLYDLFATDDVFVLPARSVQGDVEGFGTVFLEAGLFGMPSVATRTGGIPEAVIDGQTGVLVPEEDVRTLSGAIRNLLTDDRLRKELGDRARKRVMALFSLSNAVDRLERAILGTA